MNKVIEESKEELERLYDALFAVDISPIQFLHELIGYVDYVESNPFIQSVIASLKEDSERRSIEENHRLFRDPVYREIRSREEMADIEPEYEFPAYLYDELIELSQIISRWKHIRDEDTLRAKQVEVEMKTKLGFGGYVETYSGNNLLNNAIQKYPKDLKQFHTALLKELEAITQTGVLSKYLGYNNESGILYFQQKEVRINNRSLPTNAHYLLDYLFNNNPFEKHFYSEMEEEKVLDKSWKSYYDASTDVQIKVKEATGIANFLDFSSGERMYVRINPEYSLKAF